MPLERETKQDLRAKVSLANKSNVDQIIEEVEAVKTSLAPDDKDLGRVDGWLEDLRAIRDGGVIGRS